MPNLLDPSNRAIAQKSRQVVMTDQDLLTQIVEATRLFQGARSQFLADTAARAEGVSNGFDMQRGLPFEAVQVDLSGATNTGGLSTTQPVPYDREGYGIYFRKENSNPQARLQILMGGALYDLYPGQRITGRFTRFDILLSPRSAAIGTAQLIISKRPDAIYEEMPDNRTCGELFSPIDLLGVSSAPTFIAQTIASQAGPQPVGLSPSGSFTVTGYRTLRVLIDGKFTSSGTVTTFNIIPWLREPNTGLWYEQGAEIIGVPDSNTSGYRYRVLKIPVFGTGKMYLQFTGWAGTETGPGQIVQAIE